MNVEIPTSCDKHIRQVEETFTSSSRRYVQAVCIRCGVRGPLIQSDSFVAARGAFEEWRGV